MMLPIRAIAEATGAEVGWIGATRTVTIAANRDYLGFVEDQDLPQHMFYEYEQRNDGTWIGSNNGTWVRVGASTGEPHINLTVGYHIAHSGSDPNRNPSASPRFACKRILKAFFRQSGGYS